MRRLLAAAVTAGSLLAVLPAIASADALHDEAARLYDEKGGDASLDHLFTRVRDQLVAMLAAHTGKDAASVGGIVDQVLMPSLRQLEPQLRAVAIDVTARAYSIDELRALQRFYATPLGRVLIRKEPQVAIDALAEEQPILQRELPALLRAHMQQFREKGIVL